MVRSKHCYKNCVLNVFLWQNTLCPMKYCKRLKKCQYTIKLLTRLLTNMYNIQVDAAHWWWLRTDAPHIIVKRFWFLIFASWTWEELVELHGNWQSMTSKKSIGTHEKKSYSLTWLNGAEHTAWLKKKKEKRRRKILEVWEKVMVII